MHNQSLVSVCVPTYNNGEFIEDTLSTIRRQTYQNIEVIISDNASVDQTEYIVKKLMKTDSRIKYFKNSKNLGFATNINMALQHASSEFVAIYHSDDLYEQNIIQSQLDILLGHNDIAGVFSKKNLFFSKVGKVIPCNLFHYLNANNLSSKDNFYYGGLAEFIKIILQHGNPFVCPTFMGRKSAIEKAGFFSDKYKTNEDLDMWLRILGNNQKLAIINDVLINYRIHEKQGSIMLNRSKDGLQMFFILIDNFLKENGIDASNTDQMKYYNRRKSDECLEVAFNFFKKGNHQKMREFVLLSQSLSQYNLLSKKFYYQRFPIWFFSLRKMLRSE